MTPQSRRGDDQRSDDRRGERGIAIAVHRVARRVRACENLACVISASIAGIAGTAVPLASTDGDLAVTD